MVKDLVRLQDWLVKVDLNDAYILCDSDSSGPPQIPPISVTGSDLPILLPAIRFILCPKSIYKTDEASGGIPEGEKNEIDNFTWTTY